MKNPKILGVTFDPTLCFAAHYKGSADKARRRIGVLKALAGSSWGQTKETLLLTYKASIRPILDYAYPASKTSINHLQVSQNQALRVITGSTLMSSTAHLHSEVEILNISKSSHSFNLSIFYLVIPRPSLSLFLPLTPHTSTSSSTINFKRL